MNAFGAERDAACLALRGSPEGMWQHRQQLSGGHLPHRHYRCAAQRHLPPPPANDKTITEAGWE